MQLVDIIILAVIAISVIISLFRGLVRELLSLVAWGLAFWAAIRFSGPAASFLQAYISPPSFARVAGFLAVLVLTLVGLGIVNFLVGKLLDKTGLSATDRFLGGVFGFLRGLAVVVVFVLVAGATDIPRQAWWQQSLLIEPCMRVAEQLANYMPPEFAKHFRFDPQ